MEAADSLVVGGTDFLESILEEGMVVAVVVDQGGDLCIPGTLLYPC